MEIALKGIIFLVALLHLFFLWFEMFAWETMGRKIFRQFSPEFFPKTKVLAGNQGLYNGFLAAGLIWSIFNTDPELAFQLRLFFLSCVLIAGIYGSFTASKKIFWVQGFPALIGLLLIVILHF